MAIKNFSSSIKESTSLTAAILKSKIEQSLGYNKFKNKSTLSFQVLVDGVNRIDLLKKIEKLFVDS